MPQPTPPPTDVDQNLDADGALWVSYDATEYVYTYDEETGEELSKTPAAPDTFAWRLVALSPTTGADRVDSRSQDGKLLEEKVWDHTAKTVTRRWLDPDAVGTSQRPMTDDEIADVQAEQDQAQVAVLRAEVGEELTSAEVDASLAALTEDSIQYRVAIQVLVQTLVPEAQQAAVMAAIDGGKAQAQVRLAEVYDDPATRRGLLTARIANARQATQGG